MGKVVAAQTGGSAQSPDPQHTQKEGVESRDCNPSNRRVAPGSSVAGESRPKSELWFSERPDLQIQGGEG